MGKLFDARVVEEDLVVVVEDLVVVEEVLVVLEEGLVVLEVVVIGIFEDVVVGIKGVVFRKKN